MSETMESVRLGVSETLFAWRTDWPSEERRYFHEKHLVSISL